MSLENPETPGRLDFTIYRSRRFYEPMRFTDTTTGAALDLTGCTLTAHMRKLRSGAIAYNLAPSLVNAADGRIKIDITNDFTGVKDGIYGWDLIITESDGTKLRPHLAGRITLETLHSQP